MHSIDSSSKSDENVELYHQRKQETGRSHGMKTDLPNRCSTCGKGFKKPSDLVRHIRTHTGEKPFACKLCCKKFAVKSTLDVHLRTHTGKKEHKCNTCNTFYSSKGSLKIHMRLHTGSKPLQCYHCGLRFRTSGHRKTHMIKHGIIANTKDTGLIKKFKQEDSNESSGDVGEHSEMAEIVGGQTEAILPTTLDVSDDLEACNSVMVNLDGTVTLQLSGMNFNGLDASSLLSLHAVGLEDANLDPLQYGNTVSLEFPSEVIDERGETALQNVVMVQRENFVNNEGSKSIRDERRDLNITEQDQALISLEENLAAREDVDASSNHSSEYSQVLTTYLPVNSEIKCPFCSKLFSKPSECQEHIQNLHSGIVKTEYIPVEMSYSPDPLALTLKQSLGSQRKITFKDKMYNFSSDKDYDFSRDTVPNLSFKCLICKEIFVSQSSYHQHLSSEHRCSELYKNSNQFCNEEYSRKEDLLSHQHHHQQQQSGVILSHPGVIFKNSTKSNIIKNSSDKSMTLSTASSSRSGIEEDIDPLMIRDIFLPQ
ncbi:Zinc finger protein [Armadillidium vulgare]|nr:Zinc finger protein [Armadillidium vulgare]